MFCAQESTVDVIRSACKKYADLTAYTCMGQSLSYRKLDELGDIFAAWLKQYPGLEAGDRVAIQLPNLLQYPIVATGILKAGLVVVNINPLYTAIELEKQLNDAGVKVLVVLANTAANAAKIISKTSVQAVVVTEVADLHGSVKRTVINFSARYIKKLVPNFSFPEQFSLRRILSQGKALAPLKGEAGSLDELAVLQYTGGTTGVSKGAMLSHRNLVSNMYQLKAHLADGCPGEGGIMVAPLPLYHIYAFTMNMLFGLHMGHHNILIPNPRDIDGMVKMLKPYKVNGYVGINTLYDVLSESLNFSKLDFSELQICSSGGMALASKVSERWFDITGCKILEGYGLTETSPAVCCNTYQDFQSNAIGKPLPDTELKIVADNGNALGAGEEGEICVKGPQVMQGYWQRPDETARVIDSDGWLHTGDVGVLDERGSLRIVDRIKDLIIVSGFNVFPNEIEDHVCTHPDIKEAAVVGVCMGDAVEKVKLFVVSGNLELSHEEVIAHCREGLAAYKIPKIVEFRKSLPKSFIGKVLRRELRSQAEP